MPTMPTRAAAQQPRWLPPSLLPMLLLAESTLAFQGSGVAVRRRGAGSSSTRGLLSTRREPVWRLSMPGLNDGDPHQQKHLVLNHLAKCGGSFAKRVLWEAVPGPRLRIQEEETSLSEKDLEQNNFIIGIVRNPFDYYVSLWAYTSEPFTCCFKRALTLQQRQETLGRERPLGSSVEDRERFRRWLRAVSSEELGVLSLRFYGSYLRGWDGPGASSLPYNWQYITARSAAAQAAAPKVNAALANFSGAVVAGPVSCWVQTEALTEGLRSCLQRYEAEVGLPVVDWAAFNRSAATSDQNDAPHAPCSEFYDRESADLVAAGDAHLFRAFGYARGCNGT